MRPIRLTGFKAIHIEPPRTVVKTTAKVEQAREGIRIHRSTKRKTNPRVKGGVHHKLK